MGKDLLATPSQFDKFGLTLVRTIVDLSVRATTPLVAIGTQAMDFGLMLVEQDAHAAGVYPDMSFSDDQPIKGWIWKHREIIQDHTTVGVYEFQNKIRRDLKGARKIDDSELILLLENVAVAGTTFTTTCEGLVRMVFLK